MYRLKTSIFLELIELGKKINPINPISFCKFKMSKPDSNSKEELAKGVIGLLGLVMLSIAGILPIIGPMEVGAIVAYAGPAAIWPIIVGFVLFLIVSLPILEYTKLVSFAGGYYGLAELGFGRAVGKYTALANYIFYLFWQAANAFFIPVLILDTIYYLYGYLAPIWLWILIAILTLIITQFMAYLHPKNLSEILTYVTIATLIIVISYIVYAILKTPYNSVYYLNPANSYNGFKGIALGAAVTGFFLYVGYGSTLFYSEEAKHGRRDVWRAVYISLGVSALVIALSAYSIVAAVPLSSLSSIASAMFPEVPAWIHYISASALLALSVIVAIVAMLSFGSGAGAQSRLMWAMARDNFIRSNWLKKLSKNQTPVNAIILQFIISAVVTLIILAGMVTFYGYSATTIATAWFVTGTAATIVWYFHHFIPEFGLFAYVKKNKNIKYSRARLWIVGMIVPILGMILFLYTFYEGIISDLVEPYFAFVIASAIALIGVALYVIYKARTNSLGESVVSYMVAELGKEWSSEEGKPQK